MRIATLILLLTISASAARAKEDACQDWFKRSGLSPKTLDCVLRCDILPKDMSTFTCADRCDEFCKPRKCKLDPYWKNKIKIGKPPQWDIPGEIAGEWTVTEKQKLLELLSRLPDELKSIPFEGFYRLKKSVDPINPGTTSEDTRAIAIYDRAFASPFFSMSRVVAHEFGHVIYLNFTKKERQDYRTKLGWAKSRNGVFSRPGDFISSRAKDSADEDFAENIDAFLFEPERLRKTVPKAYQWISKKFPKGFRLKEGCDNAKL